ncbi:MAG: hypothetical protein JNM13_08615 [Hyphomicrobiaceae bacterium]|nr:hypothetical protein [Hyphomicrobiaceae bacterium]
MLEQRWAVERPRRPWRWGMEPDRPWWLDAAWVGAVAACGFFGVQAAILCVG